MFLSQDFFDDPLQNQQVLGISTGAQVYDEACTKPVPSSMAQLQSLSRPSTGSTMVSNSDHCDGDELEDAMRWMQKMRQQRQRALSKQQSGVSCGPSFSNMVAADSGLPGQVGFQTWVSVLSWNDERKTEIEQEDAIEKEQVQQLADTNEKRSNFNRNVVSDFLCSTRHSIVRRLGSKALFQKQHEEKVKALEKANSKIIASGRKTANDLNSAANNIYEIYMTDCLKKQRKPHIGKRAPSLTIRHVPHTCCW